MMTLELPALDSAPLRVDEGGAVRVGHTRVRLETVVTAYNMGCTADDILRKYPSLDMPAIDAVLTYYVRHRTVIDAYVEAEHQQAEESRRLLAEVSPPEEFRARLLARRAQQDQQ